MVRDAGRYALLKVDQGDSDAFAEISDVRTRLISLGLGADVIELDFGSLRAKAATGADPSELHSLCSRLAADAMVAGLPVTACEAIDWLRQISERLTARDVAEVHRFVLESDVHPNRRFRAPIQ